MVYKNTSEELLIVSWRICPSYCHTFLQIIYSAGFRNYNCKMVCLRRSLALAALSLAPVTRALPAINDVFSRAQSPTDLCGDYDYIILENSPWIVYNMLYNAAQMVGTQCTNYDGITTSDSGTKEVLWSSVTDIDYVEST
jgi:hypothetical protein